MKTHPRTPAHDAPRRHAADFLRLRHLRLLELVQQGGSLASAARSLHLSQPAVTKMLQELEAAFGLPLVLRGARGGTLTPAGDAAVQRLRLARVHVEAALSGAGSAEAPAWPLLRLGLLPVVAAGLLPQALRRLREAGVGLRLEIHESTVRGLQQMLQDGEVDCIVGRASPTALAQAAEPVVTCLPLTEECLVVACPPGHALSRVRKPGLAQLQSQAWVLAPAGSQTRRVFDALFLDARLAPPRPQVESMSFHTNLQLIGPLQALTVAPRSAVQDYARMGLAQVLKAAPALPPGALTLMHLAGNASLPVLQQFCAAMQAAARAEADGQAAGGVSRRVS